MISVSEFISAAGIPVLADRLELFMLYQVDGTPFIHEKSSRESSYFVIEWGYIRPEANCNTIHK